DANGAWSRKQALEQAELFAGYGVRWLEEPVSSDDLEGLRLVRDRGPAGMDVAAGEYGYDLPYFSRMLDAGAVDCLQADVTARGGRPGCHTVQRLPFTRRGGCREPVGQGRARGRTGPARGRAGRGDGAAVAVAVGQGARDRFAAELQLRRGVAALRRPDRRRP